MKNYPSIVLTATIIPNAIRTSHIDPILRREEYLNAIDFYQKYSDVYFLENSSYDLMGDRDFFKFKNVHIRKFNPSLNYREGKGYQEFEMLDMWLSSEVDVPSRWLKLTGRYLVEDFDEIIAECANENKYSIIAEQKIFPSSVTRTDIFYVTTEFYKLHLHGIYKGVDDSKNNFIEHVIRKKLNSVGQCRLFRKSPLIKGICGSTGRFMPITFQRRLGHQVRNLLYRANIKYRII